MVIIMQVLYSSNKLRKSIENKKNREKEFGVLAGRLKLRVDALKAANTLEDISHLPPPRRHPLKGNYANCYGIDINGPYRLIVKPNSKYKKPTLSQITSVTVLEIENYH
jgi:proteic killer suppression protein